MEIDHLTQIMQTNIERAIASRKMRLSEMRSRPSLSNPTFLIEREKNLLNNNIIPTLNRNMSLQTQKYREALGDCTKQIQNNNPLLKIQETKHLIAIQRDRIKYSVQMQINDTKTELRSVRLTVPTMNQYYRDLDTANNRIRMAMDRKLESTALSFDRIIARIVASNPLKPLEAGFAYIYAQSNKAITTVSNVSVGNEVNVKLKDGTLRCLVKEVDTNVLSTG
jgi:exonuclease VII large subunit